MWLANSGNSFPLGCLRPACGFVTKLYISIYICSYIYMQLDIALWCKNQIEHSIWDESLLFSNCARSLEYSSSSTLAGLSYHICGKLEVAFKGSPSSQHQHCTDEAQKAETVLSAVSYIYIYIQIINKLFPNKLLLQIKFRRITPRQSTLPLYEKRMIIARVNLSRCLNRLFP